MPPEAFAAPGLSAVPMNESLQYQQQRNNNNQWHCVGCVCVCVCKCVCSNRPSSTNFTELSCYTVIRTLHPATLLLAEPHRHSCGGGGGEGGCRINITLHQPLATSSVQTSCTSSSIQHSFQTLASACSFHLGHSMQRPLQCRELLSGHPGYTSVVVPMAE